HPVSPLVPYTTLFRSNSNNKEKSTGASNGFNNPALRRMVHVPLSTRVDGNRRFDSGNRPDRIGTGRSRLGAENPFLQGGGGKPPDRKSTRLNSSHVKI